MLTLAVSDFSISSSHA